MLTAHLDQSKIAVGIASLNGNLTFEHHQPMDAIADQQTALRRVTLLFDCKLR